jgi:predicted peroxiredoxin
MKFLFAGTFGSDDPTRATFTFLQAKAAHEAGHDVKIALSGDAVVLFNPAVAENVQGMGLPGFAELFAYAKDHSIPVFG